MRLPCLELLVVILLVMSETPQLASATAANLLIVPGKSIGLIRLGDSPARVRQVWGQPGKIVRPQTGYEMWQYDRILSTVHIQSNEVTQIQTSSPVFRTAHGIGPGSSREELLKAYGNPAWTDNLGPVTIYTFATLGLMASFRNDDPSFIAGLSILRAPITR